MSMTGSCASNFRRFDWLDDSGGKIHPFWKHVNYYNAPKYQLLPHVLKVGAAPPERQRLGLSAGMLVYDKMVGDFVLKFQNPGTIFLVCSFLPAAGGEILPALNNMFKEKRAFTKSLGIVDKVAQTFSCLNSWRKCYVNRSSLETLFDFMTHNKKMLTTLLMRLSKLWSILLNTILKKNVETYI